MLSRRNLLYFLDNIIVFSASLQEHTVNLVKIFQRLTETCLVIQVDKWEFRKKEVNFLGHVVTSDRIKPYPAIINTIMDYPIPYTAKEIIGFLGFLGLLGYYRNIIKDFAKITKPLTNSLKEDSRIEHTSEFLQCVPTCKNLLINEPLLQKLDFSDFQPHYPCSCPVPRFRSNR